MQVTFNKDLIVQRLSKQLQTVIVKQVEELKEDIYTKLSTPGRSLPGDPPGLQTGNLRGSLSVTESTDPMKPGASIDISSVYSRILEYGGRVKTRFAEFYIQPRPYWRNTIAEHTPIIKAAIDEVINGSS